MLFNQSYRSRDRLLALAGICIIFLVFLYAYGVFFDLTNLTGYNIANVHRYTSRALCEGKLYYPLHFRSGETFDLQFYNGAYFTNWGYGIPLLQLPFHWLYNLIARTGEFAYFPDRLIFIFYFLINVVVFYTGLRALLTGLFSFRNPFLLHGTLIFTSLFLYTISFFPLCSLTNRVYEETMCYFLMLQFCAMGFFLHYHASGRLHWLGCAAFYAIFAVTARPTALIYYAVWLALFAFHPRAGSLKSMARNALLFFLVSLPVLCFWMYTNTYKSGKPFSAGIENAHSFNIEEIAHIRFGASHTGILQWLDNAGRIYAALFTGSTAAFPLDRETIIVDKNHLPAGNIIGLAGDPAKTPYYRTLIIEEQGSYTAPFLGPVYPVVLLALLAYFLTFHRKRWYFLIPFGAFLLMFGGMVYASFTTSRFAFRYQADFAPALILLALFFLISLGDFLPALPRYNRQILMAVLLGLPAAAIASQFITHIDKQARSCITMPTEQAADYRDRELAEYLFRKIPSHWNDFSAPHFPACRFRTDDPSGMLHDRLYWDKEGRIKLISNFFMGIKPLDGNTYKLVLTMEGEGGSVPSVVINNRHYRMQRVGNTLCTEFSLAYERLITPNVLVTVLWGQPGADYSRQRLVSACIL